MNDRGDESSIQARQKSVETIGVVLDNRGGAYLIQHPDDSTNDLYLAIHWATLVEGLERAYLADTAASNRCVQLSVSNGLKHTKIYSRRIHDAP
eukprot:2346518-Pyramimonas_sp.AAC.1